ncbi:MAG: hypothetical protein O7F16_04930, partial [Acidobacteria bacterium]|nr:hypothetical protein [Acidobacteriota bacterium]
MKDEANTKAHLERELREMRQRIADLEASENERKRAERRVQTQFAVTHVFAESATLRDATSPLLQAI